MTRTPGSLGGRDDVFLAGELPELGRFRFTEAVYLEADEIGAPDEFPTVGVFAVVQLLDDDREVYVQVTEGLEQLIGEALDGEWRKLPETTLEVDTAEKEGDEKVAPWRFTGSVVAASELGPPED